MISKRADLSTLQPHEAIFVRQPGGRKQAGFFRAFAFSQKHGVCVEWMDVKKRSFHVSPIAWVRRPPKRRVSHQAVNDL